MMETRSVWQRRFRILWSWLPEDQRRAFVNDLPWASPWEKLAKDGLCDNEWIPVDEVEELPEPGQLVLVLVDISETGNDGKYRRLRAQYAGDKTLRLAVDCEGGVYDEKDDEYYCFPGWYETNEFEEIHWKIEGRVLAWQPLPDFPDWIEVPNE